MTQQPFVGNQIPSTRIDPRAVAILAFVPLPNQAPIGELDYWSGNIANKNNINKFGILWVAKTRSQCEINNPAVYAASDGVSPHGRKYPCWRLSCR